MAIPLIINFALVQFMHGGQELQLPLGQTIAQIMVITVIPIMIGMLIKYKKPDLALKSEKAVKIASAIILLVIILGIIWNEKENIGGYFKQVGIAIGILNIITMIVGYYPSKLGRLNLSQAITIAIESGLQNGTLGIVIAITILANPTMSIPVAVYTLVMFASGGFMVWRFGSKS